MGLRTGLIDADIHGPSQARMLGITGRPEVIGQMLQPIRAFGLQAMSIGFLVPEDQAMIWRGPMVMGALQQMLGQTNWGELDVMVVDLPPGTGDAQLTLAQRVVVAGAVIVSTPQDIALIDARRGVAMFEKVGVRVLGVVENMSSFHCPNCGHEAHPFGHGGARMEALRLGVPFLGEVPLLLDVRQAGDAGQPIVLAAPESAGAVALTSIAEAVWATLKEK
jgi:ATP-binding protein involved in chromosome partitioning